MGSNEIEVIELQVAGEVSAPELDNQITVVALEAKAKKHNIIWRTIHLKVVLLSYFIANYQFKAIVTVLSDVWGMNLITSTVITNLHGGSRGVLAIPITWVADTCIGDSLTLIISAAFYTVGLLLWYFLDNNWNLFIGLVLITIGQSGYNNYYNKWGNEDEEVAAKNNDEQEILEQVRNSQQLGSRRRLLNSLLIIKRLKQLQILENSIQIIGLIIVLFALPDNEVLNFLIIAVMLSGTSSVFLIGNWFLFIRTKPEGSPFTGILKVFLAAFKKRHHDILRTCKYFGDPQDSDISSSQNSDRPIEDQISSEYGQIDFTDQLSCLNRAALYNSEKEDYTSELEKKRLCTVRQVEDTKRFTKCILLSLVFLITYGILGAAGGTLFVAQAGNMDTNIGSFKMPVELFVLGSEVVEKLVSHLCEYISSHQLKPSRKRFYGAIRIGLGLMSSIPCFAIASAVESKRLNALNHGEDYYSSAFWLTPQFILLGVMDGFVVEGIACFFNQEMPNYIGKSYGTTLTKCIVGIGKLLSVVWITIWYYVTKSHGKYKFGWYIDESHLDHYYVAMAIFGSVCFIIYVIVAFIHFFTQPNREAIANANNASHNGNGAEVEIETTELIRQRPAPQLSQLHHRQSGKNWAV